MRVAAAVLALAVASTLRRAQSHQDDVSCSCACCGAVPRLPSEVVNGVNVKCYGRSDDISCGSECVAPRDDRILAFSAGRPVDVNRFCFFECKPQAELAAKSGDMCTEFDDAELRVVMTAAGVVSDPTAALLTRQQAGPASHPTDNNVSLVIGTVTQAPPPPPKSASLLHHLSTMRQQAGAEMSPGELAKASKKVRAEQLKAMKQSELGAEMARDAAGRARDYEADHADELHKALAEAAQLSMADNTATGGEDVSGPVSTSAMIEAASLAQKSATAAKEFSSQAWEVVDEAKKGMWQAAMKQGIKVMDEVKKEAIADDKKLKEQNARLYGADDVMVKMSEAGAKAAEPYFGAMLSAQDRVRQYEATGEEEAGKAQEDYDESQADAKKANDAFAMGQKDLAKQLIMGAQKEFKEAQDHGKAASQAFATAKKINQDIPMYQDAAQKAAALAAWKVNPAGGAAP